MYDDEHFFYNKVSLLNEDLIQTRLLLFEQACDAERIIPSYPFKVGETFNDIEHLFFFFHSVLIHHIIQINRV